MALSQTVTCNLADQHERRNFRQISNCEQRLASTKPAGL